MMEKLSAQKSSSRNIISIKLVLGLLVIAVFAISHLIYYEVITIRPRWLLGASVFAAIISLSYVEGRRFATPLYGIATLFIVWRVALWLIAGIGVWYSNSVYPYGQMITGAGDPVDRQNFIWNTIIESWLYWDGGHYLTIALNGYTFYDVEWPNIAFFPLYPLLIRLFLPVTAGDAGVAALLVSHLALFCALLLLYDLLARDFNSAIAYRTLILVLVFPTSLFFVAAYSESLAFALSVAVLWAVRRQRWWLAGVAGFFLTLTRLPGVMVAPLIALTYLQHHNWRWHALHADILAVLLPPLGLALFMLYQWLEFGTPVAFMLAQRNWDSHVSPPWVIPQNLFMWIRDAVSPRPMLIFQAIVWASFIGLTLLAFWRLPLPYGLLALLMLVPPYLQNRVHALPRYVLLAFPAFVILAIFAERLWIRRLVIGILVPLVAIAVLLFVNRFWLA
jgi:hypothetical protein